jgi:hypothetical protein
VRVNKWAKESVWMMVVCLIFSFSFFSCVKESRAAHSYQTDVTVAHREIDSERERGWGRCLIFSFFSCFKESTAAQTCPHM